jgi:beta-N-acetylhexosaminidase
LLFGRNVKSAEQVAKLTFSAQTLSKKVSGSPLLIAIDQEGGNVIRIRHTPTLPSALAISKTRDLTVARRAGLATGRLLKSLGVNVNLAPVVDVSDPDTDRFLGTRSFGNNPARVSAMTTALALGLQENGILPVAKHFPGHGDASGDSHLALATNPADRARLFERDLPPYFSFAKNLKKPWGAMLAHVSFPNVDATGSPATFSKPIVTGIFRKEVSASALVMTDDIEMAGAGVEKDVGQRAVRAIEAGADMVMIAWSRRIQTDVLAALSQAVESGRLKRSRIEEALKRIERAKAAYVPENLVLASKEELSRSLKNPEFTMLGNAVLRAAARNLEERRPSSVDQTSDGVETAVNSTPMRMLPGEDPVIVLSARFDFLQRFRQRAVGHHVMSVVLKPSRRDAIERILRAHPESPIFVYVSGKQVAGFVSSMDDEFAQRMILVNVETRAAIEHPERFRDIFEVYYRHPELGGVVAESYLEIKPASQKRTAASQSAAQKP